MNRIPQLRVKLMSLAEEARIIRRAEAKYFGRKNQNANSVGHSLHLHRICDVRHAARLSLLAFALLRGVAYLRVENKTSWAPDFAEVRKLADRFGPFETYDGKANERKAAYKVQADAWIFAAKEHCKAQGFSFEEPKKSVEHGPAVLGTVG